MNFDEIQYQRLLLNFSALIVLHMQIHENHFIYDNHF